MTSRILIAGIAVVIAAFVAAGFGSSDDTSATTGAKRSAAAKPTQTETDTAETEADADAGGEGEEHASACRKPATSEATGLPASFPKPSAVMVTEVRKEGPTIEVDAYVSTDFPEAYAGYGAAVTKAGYTVLHKERDAHDAEINYRGGGRQGQIALKENCSEKGVTRVHIT